MRWAIKNGDPHDQLKIAYHLILDNKRMKMLGECTYVFVDVHILSKPAIIVCKFLIS